MPSSLYEDASPAKRKERFDKLKKRSDALLQESISDYQGGAMRQKMALLEDSGYLCLGDQVNTLRSCCIRGSSFFPLSH